MAHALAISYLMAGLWTQMAVVPPGSNNTQVIENVNPGGAPPAGLPASPGNPTPTVPTPPTAIGVGPLSPNPAQGGVATPQQGATGLPSPGGAPAAMGGTRPPAGRIEAPQPASRPQPLPEVSSSCNVTRIGAVDEVGAMGGLVDLKFVFAPATCAKPPGSQAPWIQLAAVTGQNGVYRFSVAPNPSATPREGIIGLANHRIVVRQAGGRMALFAAAPGSIVISVNGKKVPKPAILAVWGEETPLEFSVVPGAQGWLRVKPVEAKKNAGQRRYEIQVNPEQLTPGRHEASIRVAASGVVSAPLAIPIVVEVR